MTVLGTTRALDDPGRHDLPTGAVPEYREFLRHVWAWKDEDGKSCLDAPPWMCSIIISEPLEISLVSSLLSTLHQITAFEDRFEVRVMEDGSEFSFADLHVLHAFLRACAGLGAVNETARHVCESVMWTLGFRWV